ncbi:hypothetical protein [Hafnia paralvei]|uniref:hypothetical protein n=1 Tax=Hafnia paralvei TaxID=546367 RepID=UPI001034172A|nr:hypothetical protein [Hafnia paralvei]TBL63883.1 hypothetical protein EYY97_05530 [Hafnia paralvei]
MKLITKNFRLNALVNQFSTAIFELIRQQNGGDWFIVNADGQEIRVEVIGGVSGIRDLVDACFLAALKDIGSQWEGIAIKWLSQCVVDGELSERGIELWTSMRADMGDSVARRGGTFHA